MGEQNTVKISIIFILLTFLQIAHAEESYLLHLFSYDKNGKVLGIKEVKYQQNKLFVDGFELNPLEAAIKAKYLKNIFKTKLTSNNLTCNAGKFILRVSKSKKDSIENGCLDSKRYFELHESFSRMRKDVVLK